MIFAPGAAEARLRVEPLLLGPPLLLTNLEKLSFATSLSDPTRRSDPPYQRRAVSEATLEALPAPDIEVWTDGSTEAYGEPTGVPAP